MTTVLSAPQDMKEGDNVVTSVSYVVNKKGQVEAEDADVEALVLHGFVRKETAPPATTDKTQGVPKDS